MTWMVVVVVLWGSLLFLHIPLWLLINCERLAGEESEIGKLRWGRYSPSTCIFLHVVVVFVLSSPSSAAPNVATKDRYLTGQQQQV